MNKGGYPSAEHLGLHLAHRDEIYAKITSLGEGTIFRQEDLDLSQEQATEFYSLRGVDYFHLADGFLVGIVETEYLRRAPRMDAFLASFEKLFNVRIRETGDRTAWRLGIKRWEPIKGYRFYTTGQPIIMSIGRMRIQFIEAPEWVVDEAVLSPMTLGILDTFQDKEARRELAEWTKTQSAWFEHLNASFEELTKLHADQTPAPAVDADEEQDDAPIETYFDYAACLAYLEHAINSRKA